LGGPKNSRQFHHFNLLVPEGLAPVLILPSDHLIDSRDRSKDGHQLPGRFHSHTASDFAQWFGIPDKLNRIAVAVQAADHQIRIGERLSIPEAILLLRIVC